MVERPQGRALGRLRLVAIWAGLAALLGFARPTPASLALGAPLVVAGEALRLWAAGHLSKTVELVTSGPYAHVRNPLYLGRLLLLTGLCASARLPHGAHWIVLLAGWSLFFGYYLPRKERVEPARLAALHGERYRRYREAVPALIPRATAYTGAEPRAWSAARARANREHWMVLGLGLALAWLAGRTG
jgi:protein-S-isoprenylcysteine O-methyltransferase Ste14